MTAKEYLEQPNKLRLKIKSDLKKLDSYKDLASSISSPQFEERVCGTRSVEPPFVRYLGKIDELERKIAEEKRTLEELKVTIDEQIDALASEKEQLILRYRYLMFMSMPEIAEKMSYSMRWAKQIHADALNNFERQHPTSPLLHPQFTPGSP